MSKPLKDSNNRSLLTEKEFRQAVKDWYYKKGSMTGFPAKYGVFYKDGKPTKVRHSKGRGAPESTRTFSLADAESQAQVGVRRAAKEKIGEELLGILSPEELKKYGKYQREGNRINEAKAKQATIDYQKRTGSEETFEKGHRRALGDKKTPSHLVGSHDPRYQKLEIGGVNKSRQHKQEAAPEASLAAGVARNKFEAAAMWKDPTGLPLEYTPQDIQRIEQGEDPAIVDKQRWQQIEENPLARPRRTLPQSTASLVSTRFNRAERILDALDYASTGEFDKALLSVGASTPLGMALQTTYNSLDSITRATTGQSLAERAADTERRTTEYFSPKQVNERIAKRDKMVTDMKNIVSSWLNNFKAK